MPSLKLANLLPSTSLLRALKWLPYIPKNATLTLLLFVKSIRNSAEASPPTACTRLIEPAAASLWALWLGLFQAREWSVCDSSVLFLLPYRELCWQRGCCYTLHASVKLCILTGGYFRQISLLFVQSPVWGFFFFLDVSRFPLHKLQASTPQIRALRRCLVMSFETSHERAVESIYQVPIHTSTHKDGSLDC